MQINPTANIIIEGKHVAANRPLEVSDKIARRLIAEGLATLAPAAAPAPDPVAAPKTKKPTFAADKKKETK